MTKAYVKDSCKLISIPTSTITSAAAATITATTVAVVRTGVSEVELDAATVDFSVIEILDGKSRLFLTGIRYEAKATRAACFAIVHHDQVHYLPVVSEDITKSLFGRRPANGANEVWRKESKHETSKPIQLCRTGRKK